MMDKEEVQRKRAELQVIMADYKNELDGCEEELFATIDAYLHALREKKLEEVKKSIYSS